MRVIETKIYKWSGEDKANRNKAVGRHIFISNRRCGAIRCSEVCLLNAYCICVLELLHAHIDPYTNKHTRAYTYPLKLTECGCKCAKWFPCFFFVRITWEREKTVCAFNITDTHTRPCILFQCLPFQSSFSAPPLLFYGQFFSFSVWLLCRMCI